MIVMPSNLITECECVCAKYLSHAQKCNYAKMVLKKSHFESSWWTLQSIYVTRDRVILKFEARVQIYVAVLNFGCEIPNSGGNFVSFSAINSFERSF